MYYMNYIIYMILLYTTYYIYELYVMPDTEKTFLSCFIIINY